MHATRAEPVDNFDLELVTTSGDLHHGVGRLDRHPVRARGGDLRLPRRHARARARARAAPHDRVPRAHPELDGRRHHRRRHARQHPAVQSGRRAHLRLSRRRRHRQDVGAGGSTRRASPRRSCASSARPSTAAAAASSRCAAICSAATGEKVPVSISAALVFDDAGREIATVGIFSDLRERLRMEERLATAQEKLAVSEKQAVAIELAGAAAHELNQPLTSVMGYAQMLLRKLGAGDALVPHVQTILDEAERMAAIVRQLGSLTRYETKSLRRRRADHRPRPLGARRRPTRRRRRSPDAKTFRGPRKRVKPVDDEARADHRDAGAGRRAARNPRALRDDDRRHRRGRGGCASSRASGA